MLTYHDYDGFRNKYLGYLYLRNMYITFFSQTLIRAACFYKVKTQIRVIFVYKAAFTKISQDFQMR